MIFIWYFKRKTAPDGSLAKHESCLCAHRGMQQWGVDYWKIYYPVVTCMFVRSMLILSILREIHTNLVYYFLAYTQADIETDISVKLPICFEVERDHPREYVIRIDKNLYGLKDAGMARCEKIREVLEARDLSYHKWTHAYSIKRKWSYYFMLITA